MTIAAPDFRRCLAASLALHAAFVLMGRFGFAFRPGPSTVEIDLTSPFIGTGPARRAAPKRATPQAKAPAAPVEKPLPQDVPKPVEPPKDWTLPGKDTKAVVAPPPEQPPVTQGGEAGGEGTSHLAGGEGGRDPYGEIDGTGDGGRPAGYLDPRLLNRDEVLRNLRKYYPERERVAGNQGLVIVDIHLGIDGAISDVKVFQSAGPLFDKAATQVSRLMRFSPAMSDRGPVRVKIRRKMQFSLTD